MAQIAIDAGFAYGVQLPATVYFEPLHFADQDWKAPNRVAYMKALDVHRPMLASVIDWEHEWQLLNVLDWAEEAAQFCERIMLIPKVIGGIARLPRRIGGVDVVLGYSIPTKFGGTPLPIWSFTGWPVHLLGGSPHLQMHYWSHMVNFCNVISADCNYHQKMAVKYCQTWMPGTARGAKNRYWPELRELGPYIDEDAPYTAFARSCESIQAAWEHVAAGVGR